MKEREGEVELSFHHNNNNTAHSLNHNHQICNFNIIFILLNFINCNFNIINKWQMFVK